MSILTFLFQQLLKIQVVFPLYCGMLSQQFPGKKSVT